jgi:hypothetical protein
MASTKVGLVYSATTGRLRWWIVPDDDSQITSFVSPNPGEAVLIISRGQYQAAEDVAGLQTHVNAASGKAPLAEDRYIDIDAGGNVVAVTFACPDCGDVAAPGLSRVNHGSAAPGGFFVGPSYFLGRAKEGGAKGGRNKERLPRGLSHRRVR